MEAQREIAFYHDRCCICLKKFERTRVKRKRLTCGPNCRQKLFRLRHPEKAALRRRARHVQQGIDPMVCRMCGKPIEQPALGRRRATCSDACRKRDSRRKFGKCRHCKKSFRRKTSAPWQIYCSEECRMRQIFSEAWPKELARRLRSAGPPERRRRRDGEKPYRVELLPVGGEKPPQAPEWWVELKFEDWLNARKRKDQRFSAPPRWGEREAVSSQPSAISNSNGERPQRRPLWGGGEIEAEDAGMFQRGRPLTEAERAELIRQQTAKLASVGITLDKAYDALTMVEVEAAWQEYEKRLTGG